MDLMKNSHSTRRRGIETGIGIGTDTTGESTERTDDGTVVILIEGIGITGIGEVVGMGKIGTTGIIVIGTIGTKIDIKINTGKNRSNQMIMIPSSRRHSPFEYHITERTVLSKRKNLENSV